MRRKEDLQEEYRDLQDRSRELCAIPAEKMTEAEAAELRKITKSMNRVASEIELINLEIRNRPGYVPDGTSTTLSSSLDDDGRQEAEQRGGPARDKSFRGMFYPGREIPKSEFRSADEFLEVATSGLFDGRLQRSSMLEGSGSSGGWSVPEEYASKWLDDSLGAEIVRPLATVWPMAAPTRHVPAWDDLTRSDGTTHGGLALQWLAEEGAGNKQTAKLRKIQLQAKKAGLYIDSSSELIQDGLGFEQQLMLAMRKSLSFGLDHSFLFGSGAGMPLGAMMGNDVITVDAEVGQAADSLVFENCAKMYSRMWDQGKKNAVWVCNPGLVPWLLRLSVVVGVGGTVIKVINEQSGQFSVFGRPVLFSEMCPAPGEVGDICFCDFSQYYIGIRKEMALDRSIIPGWTQDLVSFRILMRVDGQSTWGEPLTPRNGSTQSPFVTLGAR